MDNTWSLLPPLLDGLAVTLRIAAGAAALAIPLALAAGLARLSASPWLRRRRRSMEVFRGTSALVQLFWFYFVLPMFGMKLPALLVGIVVLGANAGAYGAEVVRGAILAVPAGQREAAVALNLTRADDMAHHPAASGAGHAAAHRQPADRTAQEHGAGVAHHDYRSDVQGAVAAQRTLRTTEIFTLVLLLYFAVALVITGGIRMLERRFKVR